MNTSHTHIRTNSDAIRFDWAGQIKLAIVLSVVAAIATIALAGRIAEPVLIVGVIIVASCAGWTRVQPAPQPVRIPVRHR